MENKDAIELTKKIDDYLKGKLTQSEMDELWQVLIADQEAYNQFETELHLRSLIRDKEGVHSEVDTQKPSRTIGSNWFRYWPVAAILLLSLFLSLFLILQRSEGGEMLVLAEIESREMLSADIYRSSAHSAEEADLRLNEALALAYRSDYSEAAQLYRALLEEDLTPNQRIIAEMNLGIIEFNLGDFEKAAAHFTEVSKLEPDNLFIHEQALWYLAHSYIHLNELETARDVVFDVYHLNGRFTQDALTLANQLDRRRGVLR